MRDDTCLLHHPSLTCSLSQETTSLETPYLWRPGRFCHWEASAEDRKPEGRTVEIHTPSSARCGTSANSHVPTEASASTHGHHLSVVLCWTAQGPGILAPPFLLLAIPPWAWQCIVLLLISGLPQCPLRLASATC